MAGRRQAELALAEVQWSSREETRAVALWVDFTMKKGWFRQDLGDLQSDLGIKDGGWTHRVGETSTLIWLICLAQV